MSNFSQLMKQAQQLQSDMEKAQKELETTEVTGESGAGLVKITSTCRHYIKKVTIDPAALQEDKAVLEDLIAAAVNSTVRRIDEVSKDRLKKVTSGLNLPEGGFPFINKD
jgi:nucleoid-associated protein EbfC